MTKTPTVVLTGRFSDAMAFATAIHSAQMRKGEGNTIPYIAHLLGVASLVLEAGGDEDQAIAGLLHDAVEDCGGKPMAEVIRVRFGEDVASIVLACSDSTDEEWKRRVAYWPRKQAYLDHLEEESARAMLVSIADKVHNARAIVTDLQAQGSGVLKKFNGTSEEIVRYYSECLRIARLRQMPDALVLPLDAAVSVIRDFALGAPAQIR